MDGHAEMHLLRGVRAKPHGMLGHARTWFGENSYSNNGDKIAMCTEEGAALAKNTNMASGLSN